MSHLSRLHHASPAVQDRMSRLSSAASLPQVIDEGVGVKRMRRSDEDDAKVEESSEDDGPKKRCRGRPRKDTKDETAADRRRTQIRLAQRAYRHRKDTAITTLEKRVKELEKANNDISKDFDAFFGILVSERLLDGAPQALQRLSSIASKITATADKARASNGDISASDDDDDDDEANAGNSSSQCSRVHAPWPAPHITPSEPLPAHPLLQEQVSFQQATYPTTFRAPLVAEASEAAAVASMASAPYSTPLIYVPPSVNYDTVTAAAPQNATFPFYSSLEPSPAARFEENLTKAHSPYQTLPAPSSFAAMEQTFGRRLQRFSCECALRLLTSLNPPPDRFAAIFGFCLFFETREEIIRRLQVCLSSNQYEDLCFWKFPFTNLGGAGTFFQDQSAMRSPKSASGSSRSGSNSSNSSNRSGSSSSSSSSMPIGNQGTQSYGKPPEMTGMSMGPWGPAVQETRDERIDYGPDRRMQMMLAGFEGDFFDPDEVETHLRQLGIFISPRVDFVHAEVDINELEKHEEAPRINGDFVLQPQQTFHGSADATYESRSMNAIGSSSSASGSAGSPCTPSNPFMAEYAGMSHEQQPFLRPPPSGDGNSFESIAPPPYIVSPPTTNRVWPQPIHWPNKLKITLDVAVLLRELAKKTVCLGRSPGVRRKDINTAVKIAAGLVAGSD
ncbi:hypothetical protein E4U55_003055 [Claviceps digitariae]|nr:hypothetical protein E4U55_003055 [Claviceps digitariae]